MTGVDDARNIFIYVYVGQVHNEGNRRKSAPEGAHGCCLRVCTVHIVRLVTALIMQGLIVYPISFDHN